jgi:drug/metabolite transporter (DMT)-like permease
VVQILNAIGALTLVYALRYGKAIIVVPMTGLAPVITVVLSLIIYQVVPGGFLLTGLIIASVAIILLSE